MRLPNSMRHRSAPPLQTTSFANAQFLNYLVLCGDRGLLCRRKRVGRNDGKYYEAFFAPYDSHYASKQSYDGVAEYWRAHMEKLEATHARDVKRALLANCTTIEHINAIKRGCEALQNKGYCSIACWQR